MFCNTVSDSKQASAAVDSADESKFQQTAALAHGGRMLALCVGMHMPAPRGLRKRVCAAARCRGGHPAGTAQEELAGTFKRSACSATLPVPIKEAETAEGGDR